MNKTAPRISIWLLQTAALILVLAVGMSVAHAKPKCKIELTVENKSGVKIMLMWLKARRMGKSWATVFNGKKTIAQHSSHKGSTTIAGSSCRKAHQTQIAYQCRNKSTGTQTTSGTLKSRKRRKMKVRITLERRDCQ